MDLASCQFWRVVYSAIKLHFVSCVTVSFGVKGGMSLRNGIIMTSECNFFTRGF